MCGEGRVEEGVSGCPALQLGEYACVWDAVLLLVCVLADWTDGKVVAIQLKGGTHPSPLLHRN